MSPAQPLNSHRMPSRRRDNHRRHCEHSEHSRTRYRTHDDRHAVTLDAPLARGHFVTLAAPAALANPSPREA